MRSSRYLGIALIVSVMGLSAACCSIDVGGGVEVTVEKQDEDERSRGGRGKSGIKWKAAFKKLIRKGVTITTISKAFSFEGLVKGGAPVVVDFELAEDGYLQLDVTVKKKRDERLEFPATGRERQVLETELPRKIGKWQAAVIDVAAYDDAGNPIDFEFFGIGVGERAVGSTAIYQVTFDPESIRNDEQAQWGFRSRKDFDHASVLIYLGQGEREEPVTDLEPPCLPRRGERCEGFWDGLDADGAPSVGNHRVGIKAWLDSEGEHDWIDVFSGERVTVH